MSINISRANPQLVILMSMISKFRKHTLGFSQQLLALLIYVVYYLGRSTIDGDRQCHHRQVSTLTIFSLKILRIAEFKALHCSERDGLAIAFDIVDNVDFEVYSKYSKSK